MEITTKAMKSECLKNGTRFQLRRKAAIRLNGAATNWPIRELSKKPDWVPVKVYKGMFNGLTVGNECEPSECARAGGVLRSSSSCSRRKFWILLELVVSSMLTVSAFIGRIDEYLKRADLCLIFHQRISKPDITANVT